MQHSAAVHQEHLEKARLRHKHATARIKMEKVFDISYCICVTMSYKHMQDYVYMAWALGTKSRQGLSSIYSPYNFL